MAPKNKILAAYIAADFLFVLCGAFMLGFAVIVQNIKDETPTEGRLAARNLLYQQFPLTAGIANAVMVFVTFLLTIPAVSTPTRGWLKLSGYLVAIDALFTLVIGLYLWILTLNTRQNLSNIYVAQPANVQSLMQEAFKCCGFTDHLTPAFVTSPTCPSKAAAALLRPCSAPITSFANIFLDDIFTALFGMCGIDGLLILATACLLKDRKEKERFRHIDEKSGMLGGL